MHRPRRRLGLAFAVMITVAVLVIGALGFFKVRQIQSAMAQGSSFVPPPEAVTSVVVEESRWQPVMSSVGTVVAVNGVTVSTDLPGVVETIAFESGGKIKQGDLLVRLDTRQEEAQLNAAQARKELARLNLARQKGLLEKRVSSRSDFDAAQAEFKEAEASVEETKALIARKTIRAPFSGQLGIRQVNIGQYLRSGDPIVPLQSLDPIYVNFSLPQQDLGALATAKEIRVHAEGLPNDEFNGTITSVDSVVNEATRNVLVQATLSNAGGKLRPGMFVSTEVMLPAQDKVLTLPSSSINYAPYGNSIYVIEEMKGQDGKPYVGVRQQFVKLGKSRGDQVAILSGLKAGEEVVTSGGFKLRNGAAVLVNNETQPSNDPSPHPEES